MIELSPFDFSPLTDFPLLWRWTQVTHHQLSPATMNTLAPLTPNAAARLASEAATRCSERGASDSHLSFGAEAKRASAVRLRLETLAIASDERVILSWSGDTALVTRWDTFVQHWDAFCYPSSDDVTVFPLTREWTLCYHHDEIIDFRRS